MTLRAFGTIALATVVGGAVLAGPRTIVFAQEATIVFIVSEKADINPAYASKPGDTLLITGVPDTLWLSDTYRDGFIVKDGTECGIQAAYPVQDVVALDPETGKPTDRVHNIMLMSQPKPLEAGTKLAQVVSLGFCTGADVTYKKFQATVTKATQTVQNSNQPATPGSVQR